MTGENTILPGFVPVIRHGPDCDYHRIVLPLKYMGIPEPDRHVLTKDTRLVFFNRLPPEGQTFLSLRAKMGFKYIMDLDDYWELYPHHYIYSSWQKSGIDRRLIDLMKSADAVTTTTALLADKIRQYNKNVHVIPNALPFDQGQFKPSRKQTTSIRFIYAGGSSHLHDMKQISAPLHDTECNFILAGYNGEGHHKAQWDQMTKLLPASAKVVKKLPLASYMDVYDLADVALVPLEDNEFNRHKSNLKVLEAGCKNMAVIASGIPPYINDTDKGCILHANNASEWTKLIKEAIKYPSIFWEMGRRLGEHVRINYNLRTVNEYRRQLFEHLLNK